MKADFNKKQNYISFSYAGQKWLWAIDGVEDDWDFAEPIISSEQDGGLVLAIEDIDGADDNFIYINGEKIPYTFIKGI